MSGGAADQGWVPVFESSGVETDVVRASLEAAGFTVFRLGSQSAAYAGLSFDSGAVFVLASEAEEAKEFLRTAAAQADASEPVQD